MQDSATPASPTSSPTTDTTTDTEPDPATARPRRTFRSWPRAARWTAYAAVVVVLVLVTGLVAGVVTVRKSFPQTSGELEVPGLAAEVKVVRDDHGVPQVYADTSADLFYAQGFVQAQDRFFEMDFRRHVTSGRLAELLGEDALETDKYIRTMGWRTVAEKELTLLDADTVAYLEAYSAGVNAYIDTHSPSQMSLEYSVLALNGLDYTPEHWTPADSVAWLKAMAWDLRGNMADEITRAIASVNHTAEEVESLYPAYPYQRNRPIVEQGAVVNGVFDQNASGRQPARPALSQHTVKSLERLNEGLANLPDFLGKGDGIGSNGWVVDGEHSTTGEPILANDPHLGISLPGIWYQMGLHCNEITEQCPFDVSGFTFSGLPGVVIGHNQQIAWGFTNLGPDVVDLYLEKVEGKRYLYDGKMRRLKAHEETIEVLGRDEPFTFSVRATRHGPLLSDVSPELSTVGANAAAPRNSPERDNGYAVAISWTALTPRTTADAIFGMDKATSWEEFREAAKDFAAPSQNLVYADKDGHIGYQAPGAIPIRKPGNTGKYPAAGWLPKNDWTGKYIPFEALPSVLDPEDGFVATANQAVTGPDYDYYLTDSWSYGYRSQRIVDLLQSKERLSVADMSAIQLDTRNGFAPTLVPYLLKVLMPSGYLAGGQRLLQDWDFTQPADSAAAAYYNVVWRHVLSLTFHDQLKQSIWPNGGDRWWEVMRPLLEHPNDPWWDNRDTEAIVETRDDILVQAMSEAREELTRNQARRAADWTWGHHHQMDLENQSVGQSDIGLVASLFNRGGYGVGGGGGIVNATTWNAPDGYGVTAAPSMRMVVSLADFDDSTWVNLTGVSGHAYDDHYVDQTDLWVQGRTLAWSYTRKDVDGAAEKTLTLVPSGTT